MLFIVIQHGLYMTMLSVRVARMSKLNTLSEISVGKKPPILVEFAQRSGR